MKKITVDTDSQHSIVQARTRTALRNTFRLLLQCVRMFKLLNKQECNSHWPLSLKLAGKISLVQPARDHVLPDCVQELRVPVHPLRRPPPGRHRRRPSSDRSTQQVPDPPEAPVHIRHHPNRQEGPMGNILTVHQRVTRRQNIIHEQRPRRRQRRIHPRLQDQFHLHHNTRD